METQPMYKCDYCEFVGSEDEIITKRVGDEIASLCEGCYENMVE